jgi:hypothetical protein
MALKVYKQSQRQERQDGLVYKQFHFPVKNFISLTVVILIGKEWN